MIITRPTLRSSLAHTLAALPLLAALACASSGSSAGDMSADRPGADAPKQAAGANAVGNTFKTPGGVEVSCTKDGNPDGKVATKGKTVVVHYVGTLTDGTKFDSSRDRSEPFEFELGAGRVIKGWDEGVEGMAVGCIRKLVIPPQMAYGDREVGGKIPANSTLIFEVELVDVK